MIELKPKYEACPKGLDWREWRKFLDLVEYHQALKAEKLHQVRNPK